MAQTTRIERGRWTARIPRWLAMLLLACGAAGVLLWGVPRRVAAVQPIHSPAPQDSAGHNLNDPADLEAFTDGIMNAHLDAYGIPGAVMVVVKDGEVLLAKGYGYANLETMTSVDPEWTLFRPGSVSKLFAWTAVMQLVETGRIDLDADVNTYLDFQIPATYPKPITIRHLMTHTPGFEARETGIYVASAGDLISVGEYLKNNIPVRVYPPGEVSAYSNYGTTLAGYIVERVSGMPFEQYAEEHIFEPLGMNRSTFRQPLPADLASDMAVGYDPGSRPQPTDFDWVQISPAGALSASGSDMAKFMIAHLQAGRYREARILEADTVQEMHRQQFTNHPKAPGMTLGFIEQQRNGLRLIGHCGDVMQFHTLLTLVPEENTGIYVSYNSIGQGSGAILARENLLKAFMDRYFPAKNPAGPERPPAGAVQTGRLAGNYWSARRNYTSPEAIGPLFMPITIVPLPDGKIELHSSLYNGVYSEVEPLIFQKLNDQDRLYFREDDQGRIVGFVLGNDPAGSYVFKMPWYVDPSFQYPLLGFCLLLFLSAIIAGSVGVLNPAPKPAPGEDRPVWPSLARWVAVLVSVLNLGYLIGIAILFVQFSAEPFGFTLPMRLLLGVPWITAALGLTMLPFTVLAWKDRYWNVAGRVHYSLIMIATLAFIWFEVFWKLIG
jgi:CubicO group peptidase (beta-lactamase class C family)